MKLLAAVLVLSALAGCSFLVEDEAPARVCGPDVQELPCGAGVEEGQSYSFDLLVHCGIEWAYFDGRYWVPASEIDPPPDWAAIERGTMTLHGSAAAVFERGSDPDVRFVPASAGYTPETCA